MKRGLIILTGESFRYGNQCTRIRGIPESYDDQKLAVYTHGQFINHLSTEFNIDIAVNTYSTPYDGELRQWYDDCGSVIFYKSNDDLRGINVLVSEVLNDTTIDFSLYTFVICVRIDLILKSYFNQVFNPFTDKLTFPMVCFTEWGNWKNLHISYNKPRVADTITVIPIPLINHIKHNVNFSHESWPHYDNLLGVGHMDVMLKTLHDSDSFKDCNPLYRIANRGESNIWHTAGKEFNTTTLEISQLKPNHDYVLDNLKEL